MLTSGSGEDAAFQESVAFCDSLSYPLRGLIHSAPTLPQVCFPHSQTSSALFDIPHWLSLSPVCLRARPPRARRDSPTWAIRSSRWQSSPSLPVSSTVLSPCFSLLRPPLWTAPTLAPTGTGAMRGCMVRLAGELMSRLAMESNNHLSTSQRSTEGCCPPLSPPRCQCLGTPL